jgi:hypothetical protein
MRWRFWKWLLWGLNTKPGFFKFLDGFIIIHILIGFLASQILTIEPQEASRTVLLPLASILVGLTFAWAGNVQSLLNLPEIEALVKHHPDGIENYVYTF